jgi:hypothetical protein
MRRCVPLALLLVVTAVGSARAQAGRVQRIEWLYAPPD